MDLIFLAPSPSILFLLHSPHGFFCFFFFSRKLTTQPHSRTHAHTHIHSSNPVFYFNIQHHDRTIFFSSSFTHLVVRLPYSYSTSTHTPFVPSPSPFVEVKVTGALITPYLLTWTVFMLQFITETGLDGLFVNGFPFFIYISYR